MRQTVDDEAMLDQSGWDAGKGINMDISIHLKQPESDGKSTGTVMVGWFLADEKGGVIYETPRRVNTRPPERPHAKSAARCPAAVNAESRYFEIKCPFDLHIQFQRDSEGKPRLINKRDEQSSIRQGRLAEVVHLVRETEWRYADRPTLQIILPYVFLADEPVYATQVPPIMHYRPDPWPGTQFCGVCRSMSGLAPCSGGLNGMTPQSPSCSAGASRWRPP